MKEIFEKEIDEKNPHFVRTVYDLNDKINILEYLNSKIVVCVGNHIIDCVSGDELINIEERWFDDGDFTYSNQDIYHIEKYNALISKDYNLYLINKGVLKKNYYG